MSNFKKLKGCVNCAEDTSFTDCSGNPIKENATLATCEDLAAVATPTAVAVTNVKDGNRIATVTVNGVAVDIDETLTTLESLDFDDASRTLTIVYKGEDGVAQSKDVNIPAIDAVIHIAPAVIDANQLYPQYFNKIVSDASGFFYAFDATGNPTRLNFIETITSITNVLAAGNRIFSYTNESGLVKDAYESVTSMGTPSWNATTNTLSIPFTNETGIVSTQTVQIPFIAQVDKTPFLLGGSTTVDAGNNKTSPVWRSGRVGIGSGTTNPQFDLDVVSSFAVRNTAGLAGSGYGFEMATNSNAPRLDILFNGSYVGQFKSTQDDFLYSNNRSNLGNHRWQVKRGASDIEAMTLLNNGNWGLNQTTPAYLADINGTARIVTTPTINTATKVLVKDPVTGQVSEQAIGGASSVVYVNAATPATATIFDTANPPVTNDDALKNRTDVIYIGTNGSSWNSNGTAYSTYTVPASTEWYLSTTTTDAGSNKTSAIYRTGAVGIKTNNPASDFSNTSSSIQGSSIANAVTGLTWAVANSGFAGAFHGIIHTMQVKTASSLSTANALEVSRGTQTGAATPLFNVMGNGSVGVGTNAPVSTFANTNASIQGTNLPSAVNGGLTWVAAGLGFAGSFYCNNASGNGLLVKGLGTLSSNNLFEVATGTQGGTATPLFNVLGNGKVGVKNATPTYNLDVNGTARVVTTPTITTATKVLVKDPTTSQVSEQALALPSMTSGYVSNGATPAGTAVSLDNLKVVPQANGSAFQIGAVSGSFVCDISAWTTSGLNADSWFASNRANVTVTQVNIHPFTWSGSGNKGNETRLTIRDTTNNRMYRVTMMHGGTAAGATHAVVIERIA